MQRTAQQVRRVIRHDKRRPGFAVAEDSSPQPTDGGIGLQQPLGRDAPHGEDRERVHERDLARQVRRCRGSPRPAVDRDCPAADTSRCSQCKPRCAEGRSRAASHSATVPPSRRMARPGGPRPHPAPRRSRAARRRDGRRRTPSACASCANRKECTRGLRRRGVPKLPRSERPAAVRQRRPQRTQAPQARPARPPSCAAMPRRL